MGRIGWFLASEQVEFPAGAKRLSAPGRMRTLVLIAFLAMLAPASAMAQIAPPSPPSSAEQMPLERAVSAPGGFTALRLGLQTKFAAEARGTVPVFQGKRAAAAQTQGGAAFATKAAIVQDRDRLRINAETLMDNVLKSQTNVVAGWRREEIAVRVDLKTLGAALAPRMNAVRAEVAADMASEKAALAPLPR